ncbi:hypothetical protein LOTGIDRAFT_196152 [Lottia gigantea]|uniref:Microsomal glutathione S-transferase 1 n=1 Tax=Lottia gigantea TaxID=225164 RepID=V3ZKY5_LOTGI|nr:hypothetical protein LOTGIDRAFT_196152 [Lottia gigantea]ESO84932.1 hypothetical protein LOTGIDRAFT_196152 [Lottia gigantea]
MSDVLSFNNPVFSQFAFYSGVVLCKTLIMGPATSFFRMKNETFSNEEDCKLSKDKSLKPKFNDATVERIRRCHQNDLENNIPFLLIGLLYVASEPYENVALYLFRTFAAARLLHTVAYLTPLPQPTRALCFMVGVGVNGLMLFRAFTQAQY